MYFYFQKRLEGMRFDGVAGALQKYTEELITTWLANAIKEYNIHDVVFSGGVAMNIKAMQRVFEMPEVHKLFVCGSASDESLAIGACYAAMYDHLNAKDKPIEMKTLPNMYLGDSFSQDYVDKFVNDNNLKNRCTVTENVSNVIVAKN